MKSRFIAVLILFIWGWQVYAQEEKKLTIAVAEFEALQVSASNGVTVSNFLRSALINMDLFTVVERSNMEMIMAEQKLQWSGCTTQDCIVQMGKVLNVKKIIYGNLSKLGNKFYIVANIVNVETGNIEKSAKTQSSSLEELDSVIDNLASTIAHQLISKKAIGRTIQPAQGETIETGALYIKSNPTGAVIWLDGENVGRTPQEFKTIPAGIQQIVLAKDGYVDKLVAAQVIANKRNEVTGELMPMLGMALIRSEPSGAKVYLDDEYRGETTGAGLKITSLPIGEHKLLLEKKAFNEYADKIYIAHKKTNEIKVKLKEKPGKLFVTSTPPKAKVYLDGVYKGDTKITLENISAGTHKLKIMLEGYAPETRQVEVRGEKITSITEELLQPISKDKIVPEELPQPISKDKIVPEELSQPISTSKRLKFPEDWAPLNIQVFPGLALWGKYEPVIYGLDVGLLVCSKKVTGVQIGFFAEEEGNFSGVQMGGCVMACVGDSVFLTAQDRLNRWLVPNFYGIQLGVLSRVGEYNSNDDPVNPFVGSNFSGIQLGLYTAGTESNFFGIQCGGDVRTGGDFSGVQIGIYNYTGGTMSGVQVGIVNSCNSLRGVQIGLINLATENFFPIMLGFNVGF